MRELAQGSLHLGRDAEQPRQRALDARATRERHRAAASAEISVSPAACSRTPGALHSRGRVRRHHSTTVTTDFVWMATARQVLCTLAVRRGLQGGILHEVGEGTHTFTFG
jgi:hypothetical protein